MLIAELEDATIGPKPIGMALYYYAYSTWTSRRTLFLEDLYVQPEHRNLGVGKRLFKHLGDVAKKEDCPRVEWNVLTWNAYVAPLTQTLDRVLQGDARCRDARRVAWYASRRQRHRPPAAALQGGQEIRRDLSRHGQCAAEHGSYLVSKVSEAERDTFGFVFHHCRMAQTVGAIDPSTVPGGTGGYEIHQKLRTKTVRLLKKEKYNEAIDILYNGSVSLLDMNEQGSGCDLAVYLLEVYGLAKTPVDDTSRGTSFC